MNINRLEIKNIPLYNYWSGEYLCSEAQPVIDGIPLGDHINNALKNSSVRLDYDCKLLRLTFYHGLEFEYCDRFMEKLLSLKSDAVIPILLCDDDTDFTCTVITAKIRYSDNSVFWDSIGLVSQISEAFRPHDDDSRECFEEQMFERLCSDYFPFLQQQENITVIYRPQWEFDRSAYEKMLGFYTHTDPVNIKESLLPEL